jgi:hypothetical protein
VRGWQLFAGCEEDLLFCGDNPNDALLLNCLYVSGQTDNCLYVSGQTDNCFVR